MTDDEQQIAQAIARAFETSCERLSKELEDAFNQIAQLMGRAQKQQYEILDLFGKQAAAMKTLTDLVAKVGDDDIERRSEHATAIEQLSQGQMKIAQFADSLATQHGQFFKTLSNRLDAVEKEAFVRITTSRRRRLSTEGCEPLESRFVTWAAKALAFVAASPQAFNDSLLGF